MPPPDQDVQNALRPRSARGIEATLRWTSASIATRREFAPEIDLPYGTGERQRYDLYRAANPKTDPAPVVLFVHGGAWSHGDRADYGFVAGALCRTGIDVAVASHSLCPSVSLKMIIAEVRVCAADLWSKTGRRPLVVGHESGAHLAAALVATDWSRWPGVPDDLVPAGYGISGLYDIEPLLGTRLNETLRLLPGEARQVSPILWPAPPAGRRFVACVGGSETQELMRQALDLAAAWSRASVRAECVVIPGADHLSVLDELARDDSAMVDRVASLASALD